MNQKPGAFDFKGNKEWSQAAWEASDWDDVAAFIGPRADAYHPSWEKMRETIATKGAGATFGFHWPAFFFSFAWFFYRKMWLVGLVVLIVPILLGTLLNSSGGATGMAIAIAMIAKSLYLQQSVSRIAEIKAQGGDRAEIAAAGGVSVIGGAIGGLILLAALVAAYLTLRGGAV